MSTIKSSAENLTLNADGANNDIKFQSNGSEVASIDQAGLLTATTFAGSGASLTNLPAQTDSTKMPLAGGTFTGGVTFNAAQTLGSSSYWIAGSTNNAFIFNSVGDAANLFIIKNDGRANSQFTAKAWVHFNGTGTLVVRDSHNVSSVTDVGTGFYQVNFSNVMASTYYTTMASNQAGNIVSPDGLATTYVNISNRNVSNSGVDGANMQVLVFGD